MLSCRNNMQQKKIRIFCLVSAVILALMPCCQAVAEKPWETLRVGTVSQDVVRVKQRLNQLGYLGKTNYTRKYTQETAETIRAFQAMNGLPETGEVDEITHARLFAEDAVRAPRPTLKPLATPAPTPMPDWPERDSEGYLAGDGEYFYENDTEGLWIYLNRKLQIVIVRREDSSVPLVWFETEIQTRDGETFRTVMTDPEHPGKKNRYPYAISRDEKFVLAFSDDFFGNRMRTGETVGIIIREGRIISEKTNSKRGHHLPNLDMMAQYPDGSLQVYHCNELTPQELLDRGAVNVFSFGPFLIRDGEINDLLYGSSYRSLEPRHALGMISPNHYLLISVQGRTEGSKGTFLLRVAEIMKERGVLQALNLDGGNTMALIFRGRMLNKLAVYKNKKFVRTVPSMIGIGFTEDQRD